MYGFPEKPNRVLISSALQGFSNKAIDFKRQGNAGDLVEILMASNVKCVRNMDQYLIIYTTDRVYAWSLNEQDVIQSAPTEITSLVDLNAVSSIGAKRVQNGILFISEKGIYSVTRGLSSMFTGEDVQDFNGNVLDMENIKDREETRIITEDPNYPVLVYNYRFKSWSVFTDTDLISSTIWKNRWTALSNQGSIKSENEDESPVSRLFSFSTGWVNFGSIQGFQRLREVMLLARFKGLESLLVSFSYDFLDNVQETIQYNLDRLRGRKVTVLGGEEPFGGTDLDSNDQWRFQQRRQLCSSIKLTVAAQASSCQFTSIKYTYASIPGAAYLKSARR